MYKRQIFHNLYKPHEYPFEEWYDGAEGGGWRQEGCTSEMILQFCKLNHLKCRIYHGEVKTGKELVAWSPPNADSHTRAVDFFVRDSHCFWYGRTLEELGTDRRSGASNAISHFFREPQSDSDSEDEFKGRKVVDLFGQTTTPPFTCLLYTSPSPRD